MAFQRNLDVRPLQTRHLDIDHLLLADRYFQITNTTSPRHLLKLNYWSKDKFLNQNDDIKLWDSNLPTYLFPQVYQFPKIIHL